MARVGHKKSLPFFQGGGYTARKKTADERVNVIIAQLLKEHSWAKGAAVGVEGADECFILLRCDKGLISRVEATLKIAGIAYLGAEEFKTERSRGSYSTQLVFCSASTSATGVLRVSRLAAGELLTQLPRLRELEAESSVGLESA